MDLEPDVEPILVSESVSVSVSVSESFCEADFVEVDFFVVVIGKKDPLSYET